MADSVILQQTMKKTPVLFVMGLAAAWAAHSDDKWDISKVDVSKLPAAATQKGLTYAKDIRPLFEASCFRCHGEERQKGELRLDSLQAVLKGGEDGKVVVPGNIKKSPLLIAVAQIEEEIAMPPKRKPGGPGGPGGPGNRPPGGPGGGPPPPGGPGGQGGGGAGGRGPGGPGGFGPPPKPLTSEQVALVRAWIEQGAK